MQWQEVTNSLIFAVWWKRKWPVDESVVDEWWLTYSTALSPSINFFLLMTDTIAMQNRPHHLSLFNPSPLTTSLLFHLGTQRGYAHAKGGKKNIYIFGRDVFVSWEKRGMKKPSRGVVWQTPIFFSTNPNERLRRMPYWIDQVPVLAWHL